MTTISPPGVIENEQEAAVAILLSCLVHQPESSHKSSLEHISRMLLLSSKFNGHSLRNMASKAMPMIKIHGDNVVIQHCAPLVSEGFRETLFAMICELLTSNGELSEKESEVIGLAAMHLGISIDMMRVMISTFIIRNRWNA